MKQDKFLIIGASGTVGSYLSSLLKGHGYEVKEGTSKKDRENNSQKSYINLATGEGIHEALKNVDRAFFLSPPGFDNQFQILSPLIQEAKSVGLKKVVLMTAMGANAVETSPFRRAEIELEQSGLTFNIIRPNWFFQNFNTFWLNGILSDNKISLPAGTAKTSFIDSRDVSEVAFQLLISDSFNNRAFDLSGPAAIDHAEVARTIQEVTGRSVSYEDIAPEVLQEQLGKGGVPPGYIDFMLLIFSYLRGGYNAALNENVQLLTGHFPRSLAQYVKDYQDSWKIDLV